MIEEAQDTSEPSILRKQIRRTCRQASRAIAICIAREDKGPPPTRSATPCCTNRLGGRVLNPYNAAIVPSVFSVSSYPGPRQSPAQAYTFKHRHYSPSCAVSYHI